jgi:hypothetical protein
VARVQVALTRGNDGKYSYDGTVSGKKLNGALATPKGLTASQRTAGRSFDAFDIVDVQSVSVSARLER